MKPKLISHLIKRSKIFVLFFLLTSYFCTAQTGMWNELHPTNSPTPRYAFAIAEIGEGKVLIFGGEDDTQTIDETWIFDFKDNIWTQINNDVHPSRRYNHRISRITKNKVLLFGGEWGSVPYVYFYNDTWIFDLETLSWTELKPKKVPPAREDFCMAQLVENKVLIFSGERNDTLGYYNDTWIYDLNQNTWTPMSNFYDYKRPGSSEGALMAQLDSGKILYYGGWGYRDDNTIGYLNNTWLFDYETLKWYKLMPKTNSIPISHSSMANIRKNQVGFWGGDIDSHGNYNELWLFNLNDTTWKNIKTNIKPNGRHFLGLSQLGKDSIILFGGEGYDYYNDTWLLTLDFSQDVSESNNIQKIEGNSYMITDNRVNFIYQTDEHFSTAKLYDFYGKLINSYLPNNSSEKETFEINLESFSNGLYFLVLSNEKGAKVIKILING